MFSATLSSDTRDICKKFMTSASAAFDGGVEGSRRDRGMVADVTYHQWDMIQQRGWEKDHDVTEWLWSIISYIIIWSLPLNSFWSLPMIVQDPPSMILPTPWRCWKNHRCASWDHIQHLKRPCSEREITPVVAHHIAGPGSLGRSWGKSIGQLVNFAEPIHGLTSHLHVSESSVLWRCPRCYLRAFKHVLTCSNMLKPIGKYCDACVSCGRIREPLLYKTMPAAYFVAVPLQLLVCRRLLW